MEELTKNMEQLTRLLRNIQQTRTDNNQNNLMIRTLKGGKQLSVSQQQLQDELDEEREEKLVEEEQLEEFTDELQQR